LSLLRPLCLLGLHRASEADTRPAGTDYTSRCSRCGRGLIKKRFSKKWVPMRMPAAKERKRRR
jgi:hypothetical protein